MRSNSSMSTDAKRPKFRKLYVTFIFRKCSTFCSWCNVKESYKECAIVCPSKVTVRFQNLGLKNIPLRSNLKKNIHIETKR
jgi:hypothetical protein